MIDDDTWRFLDRIPLGNAVAQFNDALRAWVVRRRRTEATREMDSLRAQLPEVSTDEVVRSVREDREHGH